MTQHALGAIAGASAAADVDVAVVGAGLAGLAAAGVLAARDLVVQVIDEGAEPGGRLATRHLDGARLDHGAQFFTIRNDAFAAMVDRWRAEGCPITTWCRGFAQAPAVTCRPNLARPGDDGHPRYVVTGGIQGLARHLAGPLSVRGATRVTRLRRGHPGWELTCAPGAPVTARAVVCAVPAPRALALLDAGGVVLPLGIDHPLRTLRYERCLALLAACDRPTALPAPGGVQFAAGPIRWIADNARKPVSALPALTVHAAGDWSASRWADPDDEIIAALTRLAAPWLGPARITTARLSRWRYSQPTAPHPQRAVVTTVAGAPLVFAGDAFGHPRVEGAVLSGLAAGHGLAARLAPRARR